MQVSKEFYFINFLMVCGAFFLFVCLISGFGFIFFYYIKKYHKEDLKLGVLESFFICFAIGLSIYISICFILDLFQFFNFFSAYLSIFIIDVGFLLFLINRREINKKKIVKFITSVRRTITERKKNTLILIIILVFALSFQIWIQWEIITDEYAIPSKDTYVWLGQSWYLLKNGYIWREHMPFHYPKGYTFFLAGPELIYPDWRFAYFYMKFVGIPFFSLYIIVIFSILKRVFKKNYMVLIGLLLTLLSNLLFTRFTSFVSSSICSLLILISLIIFISKCPFYLNSFIIIAIFHFNAIFALFYIITLIFFLLLKCIALDRKLKVFLKEYIVKTLIIGIALVSPYVLHITIVKNINFIDLIFAYFVQLGFPELSTNIISVNSNSFLLQFRYILRDLFPGNDYIYAFLDIERRIMSYFILFAFITLFLPTKKNFLEKYRDVINLAKFAFLVIICFYIAEIIFENSSNQFALSLTWFKSRAVEALAGHLILLACFTIEKVVEKTKLLTIYLKNNYKGYKKLLKNKYFSKLFKIENIFIAIILTSSFSSILVSQRLYYTYYFERDQIDTIFYIKKNVPEDSKILVSDLGDDFNFFYNLLSTYKYYIWDFEFTENTFNETIDYIIKKDIKYILLDYETINSTEKGYFTSFSDFDERYENDRNIVFRVEI